MAPQPPPRDGREDGQVRSSVLQLLFHGKEEEKVAAWGRLAKAVTCLLYSRCRVLGLSPEAAKDVAQQVILELWQEIQSGALAFQGSQPFWWWVHRRADSRCIDQFRKRKRPGGVAVGGSDLNDRLAEVPGPGSSSSGDDLPVPVAQLDAKNPLHRKYLRQQVLMEVRAEIEEQHPGMYADFQDVVIDGKAADEVARQGGKKRSRQSVDANKSKILKQFREKLRLHPELFPELVEEKAS